MSRCTRTTWLKSWVGRVVTTALTVIVVFSGASAGAQVKDVEPYYALVTGDRVYVRSGAGEVWYAVGHVNTADVLRVTGEDFKWLRVEYPRTITASVSVEEADYLSDRGVVVITRPSRLKAHNIHGSRLNDSWKNLLAKPLTPGAELKYVDTLVNSGGQVEGYLVAPPRSAQGYISEQFTRRATPSEIADYRASLLQAQTLAAKPAPAQPKQPPPTEVIAATPDRKPVTVSPSKTSASAQSNPAPSKSAPVQTVTKTRSPLQKLPQAPSTAPMEKGVAVADATRRPTLTPIERNKPAPRAEVGDAKASPVTFDDLDKAYKALALEPIEEEEIQPLIAEYRRFIGALTDSEADLPVRHTVSSRIALLEVRLELQQNLNELDETSAAAGADAEAFAKKLALLDRTRPYKLVGRLTASALYNGRTLPLMYRLQSVEGGSGRTLAYLVPNKGIDLNGRLGQIVGVTGDSRIDPALKLRIVHPTRVDTLRPRLTNVPTP